MTVGLEQSLINFIIGIYSAVEGIMGVELTYFFTTALAIAIFGIILGTFYKNFSRERFFVLEENQGESNVDSAVHILAFIAKYTLAFPLITFVWFMFLSLFLVFLGDQPVAETMFVALAVVAAIRMTAYWDEGISEDLAKMLPLGLLAYFISNPAVLSTQIFEEKVYSITQVLPLSLEFLLYIIILEWILRLGVVIRDFLIEHKKRIVPAPVLNRMPKSMPKLPKKVKIPAYKPKAKPAAKKEEPKPKEKAGKKQPKSKKDENWDLEG